MLELLKDEYTLFSLLVFLVTASLFIVFMISYNKIRMMIESYEAKKQADTEKSKQQAATGKETFVQELEKEYNSKLDSLRTEYSDKMIKATTLILKIKNITSTLNSAVILKEIQELLKNNLPIARATIFLKKPDSDLMSIVGGVGINVGEETQEFRIGDFPVVAHAMASKKLVFHEDTANDPRYSKLLNAENNRFLYAVPFMEIAEGELKPNGAIAIEKFNGSITALTSEDVSLLSMLTTIIGNAFFNASDLESSKKFSEEQLQEKKKLTKIFSKYVSAQVVDELMKNPDSTQLGGKKQKTTIMFSDIRGFTPMSEKMQPEEVVSMLNEYFSTMSGTIFSWNGTLDKYIGDAIMALFGAPIKGEDDELRAVTSAVEMQRKLKPLNEELAKAGKPRIGMGIGINTGEVVVGNIGSENRLEYTAIGDSVNLASRLCSVAKAGQIIISDHTYNFVKDFVDVNKLEPVQVKGKEQKIQIYEVLKLK